MLWIDYVLQVWIFVMNQLSVASLNMCYESIVCECARDKWVVQEHFSDTTMYFGHCFVLDHNELLQDICKKILLFLICFQKILG